MRAALQTSALEWPMNKRITVNLAPRRPAQRNRALRPAIAIGILAASGQVDATKLEAFEFAGELSLAGELRPVRGALAMALAAAHESGGAQRAMVLPAESAALAASRGRRARCMQQPICSKSVRALQTRVMR